MNTGTGVPVCPTVGLVNARAFAKSQGEQVRNPGPARPNPRGRPQQTRTQSSDASTMTPDQATNSRAFGKCARVCESPRRTGTQPRAGKAEPAGPTTTNARAVVRCAHNSPRSGHQFARVRQMRARLRIAEARTARPNPRGRAKRRTIAAVCETCCRGTRLGSLRFARPGNVCAATLLRGRPRGSAVRWWCPARRWHRR